MRVIITGAASGIGEAVARLLAGGHGPVAAEKLLLVDRDAAKLSALAADIGASCTTMTCDLASPDSGERIVAEAVRTLGGVDAVVSNAGIIQNALLADLETADFDRMFAINTRATWLIAKAAYPYLRAASGAIVATGSISAAHPTPPLGAYAASKAALQMLVRQLANEWGPDGIRCNCVSPGPTMTGLTQAGYTNEDLKRRREATIPLRRIGSPEDIAEAVAFLLSPASRYINGIDLLVDGGLSTTLMTNSGAGSGHGTNAA
ncbi:SDR family NAD(P)-dependent oxidoreductase [Sphingosinicella microcystinivorans]|uniref:SDR family NAD(P)-dependent oxidoreductase n=1 Tax=Sphingosinicella microcystinivorans TaxID=335406 RepID=UPI0022F3CFB3|nr:SDR family oxidoreductase [Sphingosinicella microcystinivorans]WBX84402.1 SDR family NAD(P)-dependent oxidoreductase [Sphingosinicella microcystinivorans]